MKTARRTIAGLAALAIMAMPFTAFAAEAPTEINQDTPKPQQGSAKISTYVAPTYIVTIPADTKVSFNALESDFGTIELTQARLEPDKVVRVHLASDYKLKNKADESRTIPYDIVSTDDGGKTGSFKKFDAQLEFEGDVCPLTIKITQDDWNAAAAGDYSDTVTFNVEYTDTAAAPEPEP